MIRVSGLFRKIRNEKVIYNFASSRGRGSGCGLSTPTQGCQPDLGCLAHGSSRLGVPAEGPKGQPSSRTPLTRGTSHTT